MNTRSINEASKEKLLQLNAEKSLLDTCGKKSQWKRHCDNDDIPNQIKSSIVLSEDDDSSEEEVSVVSRYVIT